MSPELFIVLSAQSRYLHGHRYVLPVAAWIQQSEQEIVTTGEVMIGLSGQADRTRVIEALVKLTDFGALAELPRLRQQTAPRYFERRATPYWALVDAYVIEAEKRSSE